MIDYDQMDDAMLLACYVQQNDHAALGALFRRYAGQAYATAQRVCRNPADAEDCVQSAFIKVMQHAGDYRGGSEAGVKVWLMKTVIGTCKDKIRGEVRRRRREESAEEELDDSYLPDNPAGMEDDLKARAQEVLLELDALPEHYRSAIWLRYHHGMSVKDTAGALGISEKTLDNHIQYGLKKLRQRLAAKGVMAGVGSIAAVIPALQIHSAPQSMMEMIAAVASGKFAKAVTGKASGSIAPLLVKVAAVSVFALGAGFLVWKGAHRDVEVPLPVQGVLPAPVSPVKPLNIYWDFNADASNPQKPVTIPAALVPVAGKLKYIPGGGPDKKGCIELTEQISEVKIDVPVSNFPVFVSWKASTMLRDNNFEWLCTAFWFPISDVAQFDDCGPWQKEAFDRSQKQGAWREHVAYFSGNYIDKWVNGKRLGITACTYDPDGRITLIFRAPHQIDDLTIRSISTNELPDLSLYLNALAKIPASRRSGSQPLPGVISQRTGKELQVAFFPKVYGWAEEALKSK